MPLSELLQIIPTELYNPSRLCVTACQIDPGPQSALEGNATYPKRYNRERKN